MQQIRIIGAGLAGCEAALYLADAGFCVELYEQKPHKFSPAHKNENFAELVCSNSLKSDRIDSAGGLLKAEMEQLGSHLLPIAQQCRVAAGGALAVDRAQFAAMVTALVTQHANITLHSEEVTAVCTDDKNLLTLIATGPLTEGALAQQISQLTGANELSFYDAAAPIVTAESLNYDKIFAASRYDRGTADYLNCPFNKEGYETFHDALVGAERAHLHDFEQPRGVQSDVAVQNDFATLGSADSADTVGQVGVNVVVGGDAAQEDAIVQDSAAQNTAAQNTAAQSSAAQGSAAQDGAAQNSAAQGSTTQGSAAQGSTTQDSAAQGSTAQSTATQNSAAAPPLTVYEGCMPIEVMARRGADTMRYGPLRPVGLRDPRTGHRPWANVQLRAEDSACTLYNIVGFQTNLKFGEQQRVFRMIPGLENAEFVRYGVMHRNTFLNSPQLLARDLSLKAHPNVFFAGQITGFEGYMESAASGLLAARAIAARIAGDGMPQYPATTMCGALLRYIGTANQNFQPMGANMGLLPTLPEQIRDKRLRYLAIAQRAVDDMHEALR